MSNFLQKIIKKFRKQVPIDLAQQIAGVQPMTSPVGQIFRMKMSYDIKIDSYIVTDDQSECLAYSGTHVRVDVNKTISDWIQKQPEHMWKWSNIDTSFFGYKRFIVNEELFTLLAMKF